MVNHYCYLMIDLGALLIPFLFSFHPRILFHQHWRIFFLANLLTVIPFLIADHYFTVMGVWGFNPDYVLGYYLGALPIEEWLFFFCIPYASVFTYYCLTKFIVRFPSDKNYKNLIGVLSVGILIIGLVNYTLWYTATTFIFTGLILLLLLSNNSFHLTRFLLVYLVLLLPFFICNGLLTGTGLSAPVVWYNNAENLHLRILTIPVEDFVYGFLLLLLNTFFFEKFTPIPNSNS